MGMIHRSNCMELVLARVPGMTEHWQAHRKWWEGQEAGLCNDCAILADYISDLVAEGDDESLPGIFRLIEELIVQGDEDVRTAACTCVLENLLNRYSAGEIPAESFVHLLGPESRAYCRAWDQFTGVTTPGV
jgi:hypothetical protein